MTAAEAGPGRSAALDGLRGIAILLVIIHNAGAVDGDVAGALLKAWVVVSNAGWTGVQLFFALSGFLITGILLDNRGARGWIMPFYMRRALRIVPAYFVLLSIVFLAAPRIGWMAPLADHGHRGQWWYWTYLSNWISPFDGMAKALPHVWSLAVEEQFYLVWPLVVMLLPGRFLLPACALLAAGALVARVGVHRFLPEAVALEAAYTWTTSRADAVAFGAAVAIAMRARRGLEVIRRILPVAAATSIAALCAIVLIARGLPPHGVITEVAGQPVAGILSASLVALCVVGPLSGRRVRAVQERVVSLLSRQGLMTIGKYSYALYLFHLPVHLLLKETAASYLAGGSGIQRLIAVIAYTVVVFLVSMLLAVLSWRLVEAPALSLKQLFPMPGSKAGLQSRDRPSDHILA